MPYIKEKDRVSLKYALIEIIDGVNQLDIEDREGVLNYTISRIVASCMKPDTGWRYTSLAKAHAVFIQAADEFSRRLIGPYEDAAIEKNGDIKEYREEKNKEPV